VIVWGMLKKRNVSQGRQVSAHFCACECTEVAFILVTVIALFYWFVILHEVVRFISIKWKISVSRVWGGGGVGRKLYSVLHIHSTSQNVGHNAYATLTRPTRCKTKKCRYKFEVAKAPHENQGLNGDEWLASRSSRLACVKKHSIPYIQKANAWNFVVIFVSKLL
jgi:hypothetical protein